MSHMGHNKEVWTIAVTLETSSNASFKGTHFIGMTEIASFKKFPVVKTNPLSYSFCKSLL